MSSTGRRGRSLDVRGGGRGRSESRGGGRGDSAAARGGSLGRGGRGISLVDRGGALDRRSQSPGRFNSPSKRSEAVKGGASRSQSQSPAAAKSKSSTKSAAKWEFHEDDQGVTAPVLGNPWLTTTRTKSPAFPNILKVQEEAEYFGVPLEKLDQVSDPQNHYKPTSVRWADAAAADRNDSSLADPTESEAADSIESGAQEVKDALKFKHDFSALKYEGPDMFDFQKKEDLFD